MQPEAPEKGPPEKEDNNSSQSTKRRRTSERTTRTTPGRPEPSNALSTGRPTLTTSSPQRGSSREMTPPAESAGPIKYTRTGRVSKATKGQRIHHCEECGKTYTRNEHLRRHQQNHKPGAFPCDVPGCGRSFYREDLLIRHKARHDDPLNPPSVPPSPGSQDSAPAADRRGGLLSQPPSVPSNSSVAPSENQPEDVRATPNRLVGSQSRKTRNYLNINELHSGRTGPVSLLGTSSYPEPANGGGLWESPPYSPSGYESDFCYSNGPPYYQPHTGRARQSSTASYFGYYPPPQASRSPGSAGSSTVHLPQWSHGAYERGFQHLGTSSGSESSYVNDTGLYTGNMSDQHLLAGSFDHSGTLTPEDQDYMEHSQLLIPTGTPPGSSFELTLDETTYTNEQRYLNAYWVAVHPFAPVVHRPSFVLEHASPLLKAAMLALGANALGDASDKTNAKIVHEKCMKVLKKRTLNGSHSFRPCDLQAVYLIEVYSIFKSRRPPLQFSKNFENIYHLLANDPATLNEHLSDLMPIHGISPDDSGYSDDFDTALSPIDAHVRQRLLLACYVLEQQHASLFGRPGTSCFPGSAMDLPFPRSQVSWDTLHEQPVVDEPKYRRVFDALESADKEEHQSTTFDVFQSMLLMACLADSTDEPYDPVSAFYSSRNGSSIPCTMEQSPRVEMAYHTLMFCKHTPVRDMLAVAGESWVIGEKLTNPADYTASQIQCRQWAAGFGAHNIEFSLEPTQAPVNEALRHALRILELHQEHPKTGLLFQEWSVYLASVAIWARAYVTTNEASQHGPRLSSLASRPSMAELDRTVTTTILSGSSGSIDIDDAMNILLWTKAKIEKVDIPHNCGLTNGALDVLGKLVSKGRGVGWFGS